MNENLIDVLIYIYENYMVADDSALRDQILLEEELVVVKRTLQPDEYEELYESVQALKDFASGWIEMER